MKLYTLFAVALTVTLSVLLYFDPKGVPYWVQDRLGFDLADWAVVGCLFVAFVLAVDVIAVGWWAHHLWNQA